MTFVSIKLRKKKNGKIQPHPKTKGKSNQILPPILTLFTVHFLKYTNFNIINGQEYNLFTMVRFGIWTMSQNWTLDLEWWE